MGEWELWTGLLALLVLTVAATLNLALRPESLARVAEALEKAGRAGRFESFMARRPQYVLATAVLRAAATLLLLLLALLRTGHAIPNTGGAVREGELIGTLTACAVTLLLVLVFGVAIPNAWARYAGDAALIRALPLLPGVRLVFYPLIVFLEWFDPLVRRLAGVPAPDSQSDADQVERHILDVVSDGERRGAVDEEEKEMIESVFELTDTHVAEIMTPRTDIVAIEKESDLDAVLRIVAEKGHSRIPVYEGTIDTVLGILYAKDLLRRRKDQPFRLTAVMREALFIPESKPVRELLREFQREKVHLAVVLDEYGGTAGLVTIEDIVEVLVGEIRDEYDATTPTALKRLDDTTVEVDARMRIDDLSDELRVELPDDGDYETIGGFVFSLLGRIPDVGECCATEGIHIEVLEAEARRVKRLRLKILADDKESKRIPS